MKVHFSQLVNSINVEFCSNTWSLEVNYIGSSRGVQMSISYRSKRDPAYPGANAYFVTANVLLH